MEAVNNAR